MKRSLFVVFCLATMVYAGAAYAAETMKDCMEDITCLAGETYTLVGQSATGCNMYYEKCYRCPDNLKFYDCTTCKSGYKHSTETLQLSKYTSVNVGQCKKTGTGSGTVCSITNYYGSDYPQIKGCASIKAQKFGGTIVSTCEQCNTGYSLVSNDISVDGCSNKYTQSTCTKKPVIIECDPLNCQSDLKWSSPSAGANYVTKTNRNCSGSRCLSVEVYSCASGYYGTANAVSQDCYACPNGGTSMPGINTEITDCYSTGGKDAVGDYVFTQKCYYAEQ